MTLHVSAPRACVLAVLIGRAVGSPLLAAQSPPPPNLETIVRTFAEQHRLPGIAVGVWRRGEVILRIGLASQAGSDSPGIDGETVFHLASVTKPFVATAVMQLVSEGKMCLDCPLRRYLPYFAMQGAGFDRLTIRQILTHNRRHGRHQRLRLDQARV